MEVPSSMEGAVAEATILIHTLDQFDAAASPCWWDLADLSAAKCHLDGRPPASSERLPTSEWAEKIGWTKEKGKSLNTLKDAIKIARDWPESQRVEGASFWQHREVLSFKGGDVEEASAWLSENVQKEKPDSVRDVTRSGVAGTGPIFDAIRLLMRARRMIVRVPAILADANALGTEPNFNQLRDEVKRLKKGMAYLDRYLADEMTIDMDEFQAGLDKILREAS